MSQQIIRGLEKEYLRAEVPRFDIGDLVNIHVRIHEGGKERVQVFTGTVIARRGSGINEKFTVRRIVAGEGVERIFPLHSPHVARIEVVRTSIVRRAKLYYLRDRVGKSTRLKERRRKRRMAVQVVGEETVAEREAREAEDEAKIRAAKEQARRAKAAEEAAQRKTAAKGAAKAPEADAQADEGHK